MFRPWEETSTPSGSTGRDKSEISDKILLKRDSLSVDTKKVIFDVYTTLLERGFSKFGAVKEAAALTRRPVSTVWFVVNKPIVERRKRKYSFTYKKLDTTDVDIIHRKIYAMYREQMIPTLKTLLQRLKKDDTGIECCRGTLRKCILRNGFKMKKMIKRQVIMESARLKRWRM